MSHLQLPAACCLLRCTSASFTVALCLFPPVRTQAVETETPDILVLSVNGELPISKDVEELLKLVRTSVYIHRNKDVAGPQHAQLSQFNIEEKQPEQRRAYTARTSAP